MEILDFVDKANRIEDLDELFNLYKAAARSYGYDRVLFSLMTDHVALGLPAGHGVMQNYPDDWMKHYVKEEFQHCDPVRSFMFAKSGPFIWDELPLITDYNSRQSAVMNGAYEAGLYNGAAVSMRGPNNEIAGIGAASSDNVELPPTSPHALHLLSQHYYYVYQQIILKAKGNGQQDCFSVTERERDILHWLGAGKSVGDIATIVNLSEDGVKYHLNKIYKKFNTNNRYTTVVKALYSGLINL
ncbi:MAG: LuxR family transcriptional regulator [Alphaproteobacteria bacterium]|nr:LuxR family transcriptional regulator [Alphaproteobacteria bacterium]